MFKLKDLLEDHVDEKYYLSQKMLNCFLSDGTGRYPRKERFIGNITRQNKDVGNSVTTLAGNRPTDNFVIDKIVKLGNYSPSGHSVASVVDSNGVAPTVMENHGTVTSILLKEELCDKLINEGFVKEGDVVNHSYSTSRMNKPGIANNENPDCAPALTTRGDTLGVVVKEALPIKNATKKGYLLAEDGDAVDISGRMKYHRGTVQKGMTQTITTSGGDNIGVVVAAAQRKRKKGQELEISDREYSNAITTVQKDALVMTGLRIRKLTPRECLRLMGWNDKQIDKIQQVGISQSQQYKQAGNGIVVQVLEAIFKNLFKGEINNE
jgi:modification methylase rho11sI